MEEVDAVLHARETVRHLPEVAAAHLLLAVEVERAVVGGDDLEIVVDEALPQLGGVVRGPEGRRADELGALEAIAEVLSDWPRAGCGGTFTAEQIAQILAVACEPPENSGRPVTHWTPRELADEVIQRGIVPSISVRHVGRFLKDSRVEAAPEPVLTERGRQG